MGKERAYSATPSITSGDQCRASLPGLALLLSMGAGEAGGGKRGWWGQARLVGAGEANGGRKPMPAALGRKPHKPSGQIPCQQDAGEEDSTMDESTTAMTAATITIMATILEPQIETGTPAANVQSDYAQLRQVVKRDVGSTRDGTQTDGELGISAATTNRERWSQIQASGVRDYKRK